MFKGKKTQSLNDYLNSSVWNFLTSGSSKRIVDVTVNYGMCVMMESFRIMKHLGCKLGHFSVIYAFQSDNARIKEAEMKSRFSTLYARRALRMRKKAMYEHLVEIEG
ncbi:hypothetical protein TNCV_2093851 [Trichonephila clavipes]|nr:hypothetical protein TNCV_2093851 [Trichonephila clavipes]